jgi:hypothetical protein
MADDAASSADADAAPAGAAEDEPSPEADAFVPDEEVDEPSTERRQVQVPASLFRVVVVFSTLLSVVSVVVGFSLLNAATTVLENPPASFFVGLVSLVTGRSSAALSPYHDVIALAVAIAGLAAIGVGVWVYAVGTRFRAADEND